MQVRSLIGLLAVCSFPSTVAFGQVSPDAKLHTTILQRLDESQDAGRVKAWVLFADKGLASETDKRLALLELERTFSKRAITRRRLRRKAPELFDEKDLPVSQGYLDAVADTGAQLRHASKWVNGVSVLATRQQLKEIAKLDFVTKIQAVRRGKKIELVGVAENEPPSKDTSATTAKSVTIDYGESFLQLTQINLVTLHDLGYTGNGIVIGILDTGFQRSHIAFNDPLHPLSVVAEYDFVDNDANTAIQLGDPASQHVHGTYILGALGAYRPGELVGAAYDASFILCKTEDTTGEYQGEEDNYVAGLEFIEANGGDVATASLSYSDWYTQADMDGLTGVTTLAVNNATANGLHCCNAAGNSGHDSDPATSTLGAPADAFDVLSCGAVDAFGVIASFSTDGPTADGRVKPEVLARGINTRTVSASSDTTYAGIGGTSLSTPLVAGAVACLTQVHPNWNVSKMREQLFTTALDYVANGVVDPLFIRGYGVIDAYSAAQDIDCNNNSIDDRIDIDQGTSPDTNHNGIPDECEPPIPTVSQWGFAIMMLSLLTAGTVLSIRRTVPLA